MSEVILLEWDCAAFHLSHFGGMDVQDLSCLAIPLIAGIRYRFFGTKWWLSLLQVVGGGALVFVAALIFGNA